MLSCYTLFVAGDRTIAPSPARLRRAWRAGVRPSSRWLLPGLACIVLAAAVDQMQPDLGAVVEPIRAALASQGRADLGVLFAMGRAAVVWAIGLWVAVLALGWLARIATGDVGPVDAAQRRRLRMSRVRGFGAMWLLLAAGLFGLVAAALTPVLAGAARAADADQHGLAQLWRLWSLRTLWTMGAVLVAGGLVELALGRRQRWRALHLSFEEARQQRRESGGRRG